MSGSTGSAATRWTTSQRQSSSATSSVHSGSAASARTGGPPRVPQKPRSASKSSVFARPVAGHTANHAVEGLDPIRVAKQFILPRNTVRDWIKANDGFSRKFLALRGYAGTANSHDTIDLVRAVSRVCLSYRSTLLWPRHDHLPTDIDISTPLTDSDSTSGSAPSISMPMS